MNERLRELHAMRDRLDVEIKREEAFMLRLAQVRDMFHDVLEKQSPPVRAALVAAAAEFGFTVADLMVNGRPAAAVRPARHVAAAVLRGQGLSFTEIARLLNRNHSTIIHSCQVVAGDPELLAAVDRVERSVAGEYTETARARLREVV